MTLPRVKPGWIAIAAVLLAGAAYGVSSVLAPAANDTAPSLPISVAAPASAVAPPGVRVRVQVLNATRTRGHARRATRYLRARGFDVVEMGNVTEQRDSTLVLDRSDHPAWAVLVGAALGGARVERRPDSARYLDVTVLLGASWRPPPQPLDP